MNLPKDNVELRQDVSPGKSDVVHSSKPLSVDLAELFNDMRELRELMMKETKALKERNYEAVRLMHDEKLRLVRRIEIQQEMAKRNPKAASTDPAIKISDIALMQTKMMEAARANYREVMKKREINQRVIGIIADHVNNNANAQGYGNNGSAPVTEGKRYESSPAMALNEVI